MAFLMWFFSIVLGTGFFVLLAKMDIGRKKKKFRLQGVPEEELQFFRGSCREEIVMRSCVWGLLTFIVFTSTFFSFVFYKYPMQPDRLFVLNELGEYESAPWGTWKWNNYRVVEIQNHVDWSFGDGRRTVATPITSNPKARKISYQVTFGVTSVEEYLKNPGNLNGQDIRGALAFELYELNEKLSQDLAEFYNPLNEGQQRRFKNLVWGYLSEAFEKRGYHGVGIQVSDFELLTN